MKRQLNTRLLLGLAIPTVLVIVGGYLLQQNQIPRLANRVLEQADKARKEDKLDEAAEHLERYLTYKPNDPRAMADYGLLLDGLARAKGASLRAREPLEKALRLDPRRFDVRRALVNLNLEVADQAARNPDLRGRADDARGTALSYLAPDALSENELKAPEDRAWIALSRGRATEGQGRFEDAAGQYEAAIAAAEAAPDSDALAETEVESYIALARVLSENLGRGDEATALLDEMIKAHSDRADAYLARARYREEANLPGAGEDLAQALELAPDDPEIILESVLEEHKKPRADPARIRSLLRHGIEANPDDARLYRTLALFEVGLQQPAAAEEILLEGREATKSLDIAWDLVNLWIDSGQLKKARELKAALDSALQLRLSKYLDTRLDLAGGNWRKAGKDLETLAPGLTELEQWSPIAARAYFDLGRYYERLARQADAADPEQLKSRAGESYELAARLDPLRLEYQSARALALKQVEGFANTLEAQILRANLMIDQIRSRPKPTTPEETADLDRRWTAVEEVIDRLADLRPPNPETVSVLRAEVDLLRGRTAEARRRLEAARKDHPDRLPIWLGLIRVADREGRVTEAAQILDEAKKRLGDSPDLFAARVRYWSGLQSASARPGLEEEATHIADFPAEHQEDLTRLLARALERIRDDEAALQLWVDLARRQPGDLGIQVALFDVAYRVGDDAVMAQCVERLREAEGEQEGSFWRYAEAGRLVARARGAADATTPPPGRARDLDEARQLLDQVAARRSDWSRVPLLRAVIAEVEKKNDEAIAAYQRAVDLGDRQISVVSRLVELYYGAKRYQEADLAIRQLGQESGTADSRLKRLQVENLLGLGQQELALEAVRDAIPSDSDDYRDFIWLGRVYVATGQPEAAERAFRRAIELAPQAPEPRITLIQFLARANRPPAAVEAEIDRAAGALPADQAALFLARAYEIVGRADQADALFRKALAARPDDPATIRAAANYFLSRNQFAAAEPLLRGKIDDPAAAPEDRAWARRTLALALSRPANEKRFNEALDLIQANIDADPGSADEKRVRGYILAARADRRRQAIDAFEQVGAALLPDDRLILARLHEAEGDWPAARERLLSLVAEQKNSPDYIAATVRSLLRHREFEAADSLIAQLDALEPGSLRSLALRGELLKLQDRPLDDIIAKVKTFAANVPGHADRAAALLEQLGDLDAAEAMYRDLARRGERADAAPQFAQFLGRHGRGREGLDVCDNARAKAPALAIAAALSILSAESPIAEADARRVESWIDEATRAAETSSRVELECQRGILLALEGRRDESISLHERLLASDPNAVQVLNNLAWILALTGGDRDQAIDLIEKAVRINGPTPSLLDTRAMAHLARDEAARAVEDLGIAIGSDPQPVYFFHLARARRAAGDRPGAVEAIDKAIERGLTPAGIDPLERAAYAETVADLRPKE